MVSKVAVQRELRRRRVKKMKRELLKQPVKANPMRHVRDFENKKR